MKSSIFAICLFCISLLFLSCGKPSIEDNAKKAAELTIMSTQSAKDNEWAASTKYYDKAQEIIDKYRNVPEFEDFYNLYNAYIESNTYKEMESFQDENTAE